MENIMKNLLRNSSCIFLLITTLSVKGMEKEACQKKTQGPIESLNFIVEEIDPEGKQSGWLYSKEFDDYIYAQITPHTSGYYVAYVDPQYKETIPFGFYYWKSVGKIKKSPSDQQNYIAGPNPSAQNIPYIMVDWPIGKVITRDFYKADRALTKSQRKDRYQLLPSFQEAFNDCCSNVYLFEKLEPISIPKNFYQDYTISNKAGQYRFLNEEDKRNILSLLPQNYYALLKEWLHDKLKNAGLSQDTEGIKDPAVEAITNEQHIIDQYIIESILLDVRDQLDSYNIHKTLENIEKIKPLSKEYRKEFEEDAIGGRGRAMGMTADGIIVGNTGILQWD